MKYFSLILVVVLLAPPVYADVPVYDSNADSIPCASATTCDLTTLTIPSESDLTLFAAVFQVGADVTNATGCDWDNGGTPQAMVSVGSTPDLDTNVSIAIYKLANPTTGNKTLQCDYAMARASVVAAWTAHDTHQADPILDEEFDYYFGNPTFVSVDTHLNEIIILAVATDSAVTCPSQSPEVALVDDKQIGSATHVACINMLLGSGTGTDIIQMELSAEIGVTYAAFNIVGSSSGSAGGGRHLINDHKK